MIVCTLSYYCVANFPTPEEKQEADLRSVHVGNVSVHLACSNLVIIYTSFLVYNIHHAFVCPKIGGLFLHCGGTREAL